MPLLCQILNVQKRYLFQDLESLFSWLCSSLLSLFNKTTKVRDGCLSAFNVCWDQHRNMRSPRLALLHPKKTAVQLLRLFRPYALWWKSQTQRSSLVREICSLSELARQGLGDYRGRAVGCRWSRRRGLRQDGHLQHSYLLGRCGRLHLVCSACQLLRTEDGAQGSSSGVLVDFHYWES